jgi:ABC-type uncharacterized transport system auxiliary subunit
MSSCISVKKHFSELLFLEQPHLLRICERRVKISNVNRAAGWGGRSVFENKLIRKYRMSGDFMWVLQGLSQSDISYQRESDVWIFEIQGDLNLT